MKLLTETAKSLVAKSETLHGNLTPFALHLLDMQAARECNAFTGDNPAITPRLHIKLEITPENTLEFTPATSEQTAACLELKATAKRNSPRKSARKDKWITPALRDETATRLVHYIIKRVQLPRFGEPFPLSDADKKDAFQVGLLACYESEFFTHGFTLILGHKKGKQIIKFSLLARIRNAIQGKHCLAMRCKRLVFSDEIAEISDKAGFASYGDTVSRKLTKRQVASSRDIMKVLRAARACDPSKRRGQNFKTARDFYLMILGQLTERTARQVSSKLLKTQKTRFHDYLAKGLQSLRIERELMFPAFPEVKLNLGEEILEALSKRFL